MVFHAVELLEEGHRPAALSGGVVVPFVSPDGDAVVTLQTELRPGAEQLFAPAAEEFGQVNGVGAALLFFCKVDVGQLWISSLAFLIGLPYNFCCYYFCSGGILVNDMLPIE